MHIVGIVAITLSWVSCLVHSIPILSTNNNTSTTVVQHITGTVTNEHCNKVIVEGSYWWATADADY